MNSNIFQGAKFGDKFLTRDGRVAIFWFKPSDNKMSFIVNNSLIHLRDNRPMSNQKEDEIVSRYQEPINEDTLDKLAKDNIPTIYEDDDEWIIPFEYGFKTGYRKSKEE